MQPKRFLLVGTLLLGLVGFGIAPGADQPVRKPTQADRPVLTPADLADKDGQEVTVAFTVKGTGRSASQDPELYSEKAWDVPGALIVRLAPAAVEQLKDAGIDSPGPYYRDKALQVTGVLTFTRFKDQAGTFPVLVVARADQVVLAGGQEPPPRPRPAPPAPSRPRAPRERPSVDGRWVGEWKNDLGEKGKDTLELTEADDGRLTGTWTGTVPVTGKRTGADGLTLTGKTANRSYQLEGTIRDGTLTLKYEATRLDNPGSYRGETTLVREAPGGAVPPPGASGRDQPNLGAAKPTLVLETGGHTDGIPGIVFTPDGKQLITASRDKTVRVWDLETGELLRTHRLPSERGKAGSWYGAALLNGGQTLALGGTGPGEKESWIYLVALKSGQIVGTLKGHTGTIYVLAASPDGKTLVSGSEDFTARIWDTSTGQSQVLKGHNGMIFDVALSPDGRKVATASMDGTARIWSVPTGQMLGQLQDTAAGRASWIRSIAWSPDGKTLATGSFDQQLRLWDPNGTLIAHHGPMGGMIAGLAFSPDSQEALFTVNPPQTRTAILDLKTGKERVQFKQHSYGFWRAKLSPNGRLAVTAGYHGEELFVWRAGDGKLVHRLSGRGRSLWSAGWGPDSKTVAWGVTGADTLGNVQYPLKRQFNLGTFELGEVAGNAVSRAVTEKGPWSLEWVGNQAAIVVKDQGKPTATIKIGAKAFSLISGDRVAASNYANLELFEAGTGKRLRTFQGHTGDVRALAPSPDARYLLSAASDQTLRIWDPNRQDYLLSLFFSGDDWIAWTPEGYYAASPGGENLMGWQVNNGPDRLATFYPAAQFRKMLYRPDVIQRLLDAGSLEKALAEADKSRGQTTRLVMVAQILPPKVTILTPKPTGQPVTDPSLAVEAQVESVGDHPITSIHLLLDGRPIPDGVQNFNPPRRGQVRATWTVAAIPGTHRLTVQATNAVSKSLSDEVEVTFGPANQTPAKTPTGSLYLLAIGINAYPGRMKLDAAVPDARALDKTFQQCSHSLFQKIYPKLLLDQDASRRNILAELDNLHRKAKPGDVVVVFYAGHGDSKLTGELHLVPVDADLKNLAGTGVSGETLRTKLGNLPCTTLVILDACYTGSFDRGKKKRALPMGADNLVREFIYDAGLVVMCGAGEVEEAGEEKGHGYFTRALVEGLSGQAPKDEMGIIDLDALQLYVGRRVKKLSDGEQEPTIHRPSTVRNFPLARP